jgi:predicted ATPase/DNA-binding SARP family transcriptional activator
MADGQVVGLLGTVCVWGADGEDRALRGHAAHLLALLALQPGRTLPVDELTGRLWPDGAPPTARTALQGHVSRIRRTLPVGGPVRIETVPGGYVLLADDPATIDVEHARSFVDRAAAARTAGETADAVAELTAALAVWRGPALSDLRAHDPALAAAAAGLDDERRAAEEALADALVAAGDIDRAIALAGRLVNEEPLRERRWALLMTALTRAGRQTDALRAYRQAAAILADRTGLEPGHELRRLETAILLQDPSLDAARWQPAPGSRPTPLIPLVGRDAERATVAERLATHRVVSIVGPGGVGKTVLAVDVAARAAGDFPDGVVVVDLGATDGEGVASALAAAIGAPATEGSDPLTRAVELLAGREALLVLDGCERPRGEAATAAAALLRASPRLRLLATGPGPLGVAGEAVVTLQPLAPPPGTSGGDEIRGSAAVQLLVERLEDQGVAVGDDDWPAVAAIARTLDGLPLALEIAASAARAESLDALAGRLADDSSAVLSVAPPAGSGRPPLGTALDAALARLGPAAHALYPVLSVFPGSFDEAGAAGASGLPAPDVAVAVRELTEAALVQREQGGDRWRLLQPVRAHAAALLDEDVTRAAHERLAAWCTTLASELDAMARGPGQVRAVDRFVAELPTIRSVLRRLLDAGDIDRAAELFEGLVLCWVDSPASPEALTWADDLLAHADRLEPGPRALLEVAAIHAQYAFELIAAKLDLAEKALRRAEEAHEPFAMAAAQVQVAIGLGWRNIDLDRAAALADASRAGMQHIDEPHWAAIVLEIQGLVALRRLDIPGGIATLEQAAGEHRRHGRPTDVAHALTFIGYARRAVGDLSGARRAFDEAARALEGTRVGTWLRAIVGSAHAALALGDVTDAAARFRTAHDRAVQIGDRRIVSTALAGLAATARAGGDDDRCVALLLATVDAALGGGDPSDAVGAAGVLGEMLVAHGAVDEAAVLLGAADLIQDEVGVRVEFGLVHDLDPLRSALVERLGAERTVDLAGDGRVIGLPAAVRRAGELLLGGAARDGPPDPIRDADIADI